MVRSCWLLLGEIGHKEGCGLKTSMQLAYMEHADLSEKTHSTCKMQKVVSYCCNQYILKSTTFPLNANCLFLSFTKIWRVTIENIWHLPRRNSMQVLGAATSVQRFYLATASNQSNQSENTHFTLPGGWEVCD